MLEGLLGNFGDPNRQAMLGFAQGLLQGSSPSQTPVSLGGVMAPALQGASQNYQKAIASAADLARAKATGVGSTPALIQEYQFAVKNDGFTGSFAEFVEKYKQREKENFGITPTYYERPDGTLGMMQLGNRGNTKDVPIPGGGNALTKGMEKIDRGDSWELRDPVTKQTVGIIPKNLAQAEEDKATGKSFGDDYNEIKKRGIAATNMIPTLERVAQLSPQAYAGTAAPVMQTLRSMLTSFGIDSKTVAAGEELSAITNKLTLQDLGGSLGVAISNGDRAFIESTFPNLATSERGRQQLVQYLVKVKRREQEMLRMADEWRDKHKSMRGFARHMILWSEQNPLFEQPVQRGGMVGPPGTEIVGGGVVDPNDPWGIRPKQ
jgi:hypothetical protein